MKKIRWGIMGTGRIAGIFCDVLKGLEQAEIYAVASRNQEKASAFSCKYNASKAYGSYEELVADEEVDIIYVATPIACHYENVKLCLNAGKNVLCEKAFTESLSEARELYELSKEKNVFLMEAMWTKCQPVFRKIIEWKDQGKLGEIQAVEGRFYTLGTKDHRLITNPFHCGALFDLMIYPLMYACALLGYKPENISALAVKGNSGTDIMDSVQLSYKEGGFASLTCGIAHERQISMYIQGSKGRILIQKQFFFMAEEAVLVNWENEPVEEFKVPFMINGYEYEAIEAMECISQGKTQSNLVPMEETMAIIGIMEECRKKWAE